jgi:MoxR-like ATPase
MDTLTSLVLRQLEDNLNGVIRGKTEMVRLVLVALLAGGHALLEDVPGTGKTTLAKALARSIDGVFRRIQFTPDLLPADITGSSIYRPQDGSFEFREGPVFANVLLADEINRTSPRTQSALLEVMNEKQVSVEGQRRALPEPFFVIATQNPGEFHGTYPLPESQLDRFAVCVTLGYPTPADELEIIYSRNESDPLDALDVAVTCADILALQETIRQVRVERSVTEYALRLVAATRADTRVRLPVSPRGSLILYRCAQALAHLAGRDFALPEDIRALVVPTLAHRIHLHAKARYGGILPVHVLEEALETVPVPR